MDILKWIASFIPRDPSNEAGMGPFRLPSPECDWMQEIFEYHDLWYDIGPKSGMPLSDIDWRIFKALSIKDEEPIENIERCHRVLQICEYWPIMRKAGHYLYKRNYIPLGTPNGKEESTSGS